MFKINFSNNLFLSFFLSISFAFSVFAQEIEEVVVTGSRIATSNETSSQPLLSISSDALTNSGQFDLSEVLNDTPSLTASITATNSIDDTKNMGAPITGSRPTVKDGGMGIKKL